MTKETTIWCDFPDCVSQYQDWGLAAGVRRELKGRGWKHRKGKDYCPRHADTGDESPE